MDATRARQADDGGARSVWIVIALLMVGAGALFVWRFAAQSRDIPRPADLSQVLPAPTTESAAPLPTVAESDARVREAAGAASAHAGWRAWLSQSDLVTRIVATLDGLAEGRVARNQLDFLAPKGHFR